MSESYQPSRVVVLGSNAFSGQDFCDLLLDKPGIEVIGISRSAEKPAPLLRYRGRDDLSRFRFQQFDMNRDSDALIDFLDQEKPDAIVNFAAQSEVGPSWEHPEHWFETNTVSLAKMVNALRRRDYLKRYLHVSSPEAYGNCVGRVTEDTPDNPSTPYAASKAAADMLLEVYRKQYGLPVMNVRATNVYGARQQLFKIIPRSVIYLKLGRTIQLHGGGHAVKSYIHVRDVSEGEFDILTRGEIGQRYHLSPDGGVAVRDVVAEIAKRLGKSLEEVTETVADRPGQDAAYVIDSTKAREAFGWRARISLEEGIDETVSWVEDNWDFIRSQSLDYEHKA
ncbi:dTDP-glucose 4,6-dehydratase [Tistlia consotensis]|uniref:dTDP-glucose 4,6-dehydratase n=1 Tax=Tistlia consotensis USBA 355 TaxID=560819 RepID=A0A1Y6B9V5_9PROT|nr:GDP-mannose 4,6-dehydratase [Tistlia consotensis]SME99017.1 dTDP-glucose 4,6-dehydratase [Tistlia consotensis USBA 355]SNR77508.1 dTDP-glucose 4,6-dehydratase [Tistlia consotensis]